MVVEAAAGVAGEEEEDGEEGLCLPLKDPHLTSVPRELPNGYFTTSRLHVRIALGTGWL